ncbi:hypothetical protein AQJ91_35015 [Streptomyces dysideae]|uniref:Major facilitator superfamily (MFS) profile domain-containing protein n=1 Tax=Streptomyces dysideae TaxID=909626 RepID=A0A101UTC6_9ACTN|nr:hypothetical protein AQJ91_35015 [Streptomyces dysideae]
MWGTLLVLCAAMFLDALDVLSPVYAAVILPTMLLVGAVFALTFPSLNVQATSGVDEHEQGMLSGLLNTSVQVGGALFLAVVTAVLTANAPAEPASPQAVLDSHRPALTVITGIAVVGPLIALTGLRTRRRQQSVVVTKSTVEEAEAEPVAVRDQGDASRACARRSLLALPGARL